MSIDDKNAELIEKSLSELDKLRSETFKLLDIRSKFEELLESNNKLPIVFDERFSKIKSLVESFTLTLGKATKAYIDGNNELFIRKLDELKVERDNLQKQIDALESLTQRLESIDLEEGFRSLRDKLSKILEAISSINLTMIDITGKLSDIQQLINGINTKLTYHTELLKATKDIVVIIENHLKNQDDILEAIKNDIKVNHKAISNQNDLIITETKQLSDKLVDIRKTMKRQSVWNKILILVGILSFVTFEILLEAGIFDSLLALLK